MITRRLLTAALAAAPLSAAPTFARAQSSDPKFAAWLQGLRAEAARAGVDGHTLDAALGSVEQVPQVPQVLELAHSQPEFKMTFERYLEIVVSPERAARGRALLKENSALLQRFSGSSGVADPLIVALWGIESNSGTNQGDFEIVPALATLSYNGFRAKLFRSELIAALKILAEGNIGLHAMKGSRAGATSGPTRPMYSRPSRIICAASAGAPVCAGARKCRARQKRRPASASCGRRAPAARPIA